MAQKGPVETTFSIIRGAGIAPGPPGASRRPLALPGVPWAILVTGARGYFFISSFLVFECVRRSGTFRALLFSGCLKVVIENGFSRPDYHSHQSESDWCGLVIRFGLTWYKENHDLTH